MRAVILQHESHEDAGLLGPALTEVGFQLVKRFRDVEHADLDAELVVVLGGPMAVYEADQHPFLRKEQAFLSERLALDRPTLGICLGAQLLAAAAGAEVFKGKNGTELGVGPIRWTKAASEDPVFAGAPSKTVVAHWHGDTFTPVPGATLLASTERYTQQAFRLGKSYALQFHLELSGALWLEWVDACSDELKATGKDLEALKAEAKKLKAAEPANVALLARLAHHFAKAVG